MTENLDAKEQLLELEAEKEKLFQEIIDRVPSEKRAYLSKTFKMQKMIKKESDRGASLYISAHIDDRLQDLLKTFFIDDSRVISEMFKGNGPLATFSSRINLLYALGFIDIQTKRDIDIIRSIRNTFAHSSEDIDFSYQSIAAKVDNIKFPVINISSNPRSKFISKCMSILGYIESMIFQTERRVHSNTSLDEAEEIFKKFSDIINNKGD